MASYEVESAFRRVAETFLKRQVTDLELGRIIEGYERSVGSTFDRAIQGLAFGGRETEGNIRAIAASSDDAQRVMIDLQNFLNE